MSSSILLLFYSWFWLLEELLTSLVSTTPRDEQLNHPAYYVRIRGRQRGPFSLPKVQDLVRRGELSRKHEVSTDGHVWKSAVEFAEVFSAPNTITTPVVEEPIRSGPPPLRSGSDSEGLLPTPPHRGGLNGNEHKVEEALKLIVDETTAAVLRFPNVVQKMGNEVPGFSELLPPLLSQFENESQTTLLISAASISDLLYLMKQAILVDDAVTGEELDAAQKLLSGSFYRFSCLDEYTQFQPLVDGSELGSVISTWEKDASVLGGDVEHGALVEPFSKLVMLASLVTNDIGIHDRFTQVTLLIAKLILRADGVSASEQKWLQAINQGRANQREVVVELQNKLEEIDFEEFETALAQAVDGEQTNETRQGHKNGAATQKSLIVEGENAEGSLPSRESMLSEAKSELEALVGVNEVKQEIKRLANFLKIRQQRADAGLPQADQSLHFVFTGNPGTGKTTVARIIAKVLYGYGVLETNKLFETDRAGLVAGFVGQTAIKTKEIIAEANHGVLFVDEAYTLSGADDQFGQEAIDTILKAMEDMRDSLVVIAAGYPDLMADFLKSNPGLQSRFTRFVEFSDYCVSELCQIFELMCKANSYELTTDNRLQLAVFFNYAYSQRDESFGNGRFVRNIYEITLGNHADRLASSEVELTREMLTTIHVDDIPFDQISRPVLTEEANEVATSFASALRREEEDEDSTDGMAKPIDFTNTTWRGLCPGCGNDSEGNRDWVGKRVHCECGTVFVYPWWNFDVHTCNQYGLTVSSQTEELNGIISSDS